MYYHVRISQWSSKAQDETKVDLSEEQLYERFLQPYERGLPIIINDKTIPPDNLERIRISRSREPSSPLIEAIKVKDHMSPVVFIGGPSYEWQAANEAEDVTDEFILGPPGYKTHDSQVQPSKDDLMPASSKKVFVVHGHDLALKNDVEVFLRDIGLQPVVLHRETDEGQTIIEKFERHSEVNYAIILMTPDDAGFSVDELKKPEAERAIESRARQNVVFEFGYFAGKLGRSRVCCIYKEGVALPSDLSGFIYKKVKTSIEEVGYSLIKEFRAAGFEVKLSEK